MKLVLGRKRHRRHLHIREPSRHFFVVLLERPPQAEEVTAHLRPGCVASSYEPVECVLTEGINMVRG